jgi:two-component sensor histidine kinase
MVDLGRLVGNISKFSESDDPNGPVITLDASGPPVLTPSREATSLALVTNELVQNAIQHGRCAKGEGSISIRVSKKDGIVMVAVRDDGPGLPEGFDPQTHGNLGLTIVQTLVKDDLKGQFSLKGGNGTTARVTFPLPEDYYRID